ncbi:MAG: ABC transporter ATP-binding protein [Leptolyngbyaceae cyanobacterium bins.59]|nr:ABC transporter ATP-binding protein [Leptolyngbyaceae cyanobacterium bins.59]
MTYLRLENITKRFGPFLANDRISFEVKAGTIHALLGENGAGKTTLMNILYGLYQPDAGQIFLGERSVQISSPSAAIQLGIGMIHQHFMLVPQLTVTENIVLGTGIQWRLDLRRQGEKIAALSRTYGLEVDPQAKVADLSVGAQQRVEILKALYRNANLLILDEPTAVLTPLEVEAFFRVLKQLATDGRTLIFISHKLEEVMQLCNAVTVLRRGQVVASVPIAETNPRSLAALMVGREMILETHKSPAQPGSVALEVQNLQVKDDRGLLAVRGVSFQLRSGEILGIAGMDGNGQRELADAIVGLQPAQTGRIEFNGKDVTLWSVQQRVKHLQLGYIPEDRQKMGLVMGFSITRNLILKLFKALPFCRRWFLQSNAIRANGERAIEQFDIRTTSGAVKVSQLSGGNQQKVVLARELGRNPAVIIAMQPTRGLDVGATESVQQCLLAERDRGAAILYISTELEEVMAMGDRIAVMEGGRFVEVLDGATATSEQIGFLMAGGEILTDS